MGLESSLQLVPWANLLIDGRLVCFSVFLGNIAVELCLDGLIARMLLCCRLPYRDAFFHPTN